MFIISQTTTLLQIFYELMLYSLVIFRSMRVADDTFQRNSECEWVKGIQTEYPLLYKPWFISILRLLYPKHNNTKIFEDHLNLVKLVLIGKLSLSTLR